MYAFKAALLSFQRNISCYAKDKRTFVFCVCLQILIAFASIVCYGFMLDTARVHAELRDSVRMYQVFFEAGKEIDSLEQIRIWELLYKNPYVETELIGLKFSASYEDTHISAMAFSNVSSLDIGVKGTRISETDNNQLKRILLLPVFSTPDTPLAAMKETAHVGQSVKLNGREYEVIGVQELYGFEAVHVPLAVGLLDMKLQQADIILPAGTDETNKRFFTEYLTQELPYAEIVSPMTTDERALAGISLFLYAGVAAIVCAILAFAQMYLYFVKRDRYEHAVMLVCGCSKKKGDLILLLQFNLLFFFCFLVSVLLAEAALFASGRVPVSFFPIVIIYLIFAAILTTVMRLFIKRNSKWTEGREG